MNIASNFQLIFNKKMKNRQKILDSHYQDANIRRLTPHLGSFSSWKKTILQSKMIAKTLKSSDLLLPNIGLGKG
mgnify:CR=1 FL=1